MNKELKTLLLQYRAKFNAPFPVLELPPMETDELITFIKKCLEKEKEALEIKPTDTNGLY